MMEKRILNKILNLIREEGPTMTSGSNPQGFSSAANSKGPVAGFDPVMGKPQVHIEVNRQSAEIKAGCERDIRKVDERLRTIEKKMWTIAGAIAIISFVVSPIGQRVVGTILTPKAEVSIIESR